RFRCRKLRKARSFLSTLTPSTTTPDPDIAFANWFNDGISSTQGGHHVAQKFRTRSLPPKSVVVTFRPDSVVMENDGADSPASTMCCSKLSRMTYRNVAKSATNKTARIRSLLPI